ncbi:MAG TPA: pyruvate formate lyase family protein [Planctomycetota bacterium]|nr:pyruvate formate lyase family protein [Planctomycetota bacterium]HRR81751.1 pyruvate formate lyase family protein [Planctomycetota bacterium]HRT94186.1 pyruvate formate lyase family protein [Planctomycetota bacterium]
MNDRISFLRERALTSRYVADPDWKRLREESLAQTEGEPAVVREAKALAHYWLHRPIAIHEGELLVGARAGLIYGAERSKAQSFGRQRFEPWWPMPDHVAALIREGVLSPAGNHTTLDYDAVLSGGFHGLIARIEERRARLAPDAAASVPLAKRAPSDEPRAFLDALRLVAEGYIAFCRRHADLAETLAAQHESCHSELVEEPFERGDRGKGADSVAGASSPERRFDALSMAERRCELLTIAAHCRRVVAEPPRTFWEACQAAWFAFLFAPDAPGRVDQYLCPFYRRDIAAGTLTPEFARELLACLWLKVFEFMGAEAAVAAHQHLTLGGTRADGADVSNELTWLCLDVTEELRLQRPQVGLRCHAATPPALLRRAVRVLRTHAGNPDFCNDEQIVPALVRLGVAPEDARDFSLSGCHEVIVTGKAQMGAVEGFLNLPKLLRVALGLEPKLPPPRDPAALDSFEKLWAALEEAIDAAVAGAHAFSLDRDRRQAEIPGGILTASLVTSDCIEACRGYTQGGARYNFCNWDAIGLANLADALVAIRRLVYDEHVLTLAELAEALRTNWDGREGLRQRIVNRMPRFGNDEPEPDALAARILERLEAILARRTPFRGGRYTLGTLAGGENMHVEFGRLTGATPDGRRAGEPLADSLAAAQGRDRRGVTAMLNSVAKLPHRLLPTSVSVNVKLDPALLESDAGVEKVAALIAAHFAAGGQQLQFNFVNRAMLLEARRCPEKHAGLMVRVAGYSAPFISLWEDLQDEIIARTEHRA